MAQPNRSLINASTCTINRFFSIGLVALTILRLQQERSFVANMTDIDAVNNNEARAAATIEAQHKNTLTRGVASDEVNSQQHHEIISADQSQKAFNYTAYWEQATQTALESLSIENPPSPEACPKVYVYDLPSHLKDASKEKEMGFGKKIILKGADRLFQGFVYNTNQYAFPSILEQRLRESKVCRTKDPNEADLFFVPVLSAPKGTDEWKAVCFNITGEAVRAALPHLNATNACRHFFAFGKGHYIGQSCTGWFSKPIAALKPFLRLAYSHRSFDIDVNGTHSYTPLEKDNIQSSFPNLFSVPYPSSLHYGGKPKKKEQDLPQIKNPAKKSFLMSYIGKVDHGDLPVRTQIAESCTRYKDKKVCSYTKQWATKYATLKSKATFCLEPAGDSPWRKSLADSISFGCIPVLFSELTDDVAPWFWSDWKARARVLVPRDEFVAGRIDLKVLLESIPPKLLELLQTTLKEKGRKFQYSVDDNQEDGIRVILDNLYREVTDRESRGMCGNR